MEEVFKNSDLMRRRSTLERYLSVFACLTVIGLLADASSANDVICKSTACKRTSAEVLAKIKTDVEPCDNFYQFACGNFIEKTKIAEDSNMMYTNTISLLVDKTLNDSKVFITKKRPESEPKYFQLPNTLYRACMNTSLLETLGSKPMQQISDRLGGWPVIVGDSWDADNTWSWQETVKKFRRLGFSVNYLMKFEIAVDLKNDTKRIIKLDQADNVLDRKYLITGFKQPKVAAYYDYMVDIAVLFGAEKAAAKKELKEALQFAMDLAKITWEKEKRINSSELYNLRSIKELQESYPYVQWLDYINGLLPEGLEVDENEEINLAVPSFFDNLGILLHRTDKRVIANYMMWRIHASSVQLLSRKFRNRHKRYQTALYGKMKSSPRWEKCLYSVWTGKLGILVDTLYLRKYFKPDAKESAVKLFNNIRGTFSHILDEVQWMDNKTIQEAKSKLQSMATYIGYPDEMIDNNILEKFYSNLKIDPDKFLESFLSMNVFKMDCSFNKLRLPVDKSNWIDHAHPTDFRGTFYSSDDNSLDVPANILRGHFFNNRRPNYMNYGAIGHFFAHEITHVVGDLGDWWQRHTQTAFLEKAKCMIEQYGNYTDKQFSLNINGTVTLNENIADNGGIKVSYLAYNEWVAKNGKEPKLPGLNFTAQQMFWISVAQSWCTKYSPEAVPEDSDFAPEEFRVFGPLSNMQDFSRDFQCPEGAPMNPVRKCEVW